MIMSKNCKSRSSSLLQSIRDRMMLFFPLFLFALVSLNCFVAWRSFTRHDEERKAFARSVVEFRSEVSYLKSSYESHITNLLNSVVCLRSSVSGSSSGSVSSVSSPVPSSSSSSSSLSVPVSFHFYSHGGFPYFRYFGSEYSIGSETSFGRVLRIFPDRVFFDSGYVFVNSRNPDDAFFRPLSQSVSEALRSKPDSVSSVPSSSQSQPSKDKS